MMVITLTKKKMRHPSKVWRKKKKTKTTLTKAWKKVTNKMIFSNLMATIATKARR